MRRATAILSVVAVVLVAAGLAAQAKPTFAGEWKIDAESGGGRGAPGVDLVITQGAASMTVEYVRGGPTPAPVKLTYKLDGSVSKNMIAGRAGGAPTEQASKAIWAGNNLVVTTTTVAGEEKRTFSTDGFYLVVETSAAANGGAPKVTKVTYKRYERGFGG
jgi:hypothetical protein